MRDFFGVNVVASGRNFDVFVVIFSFERGSPEEMRSREGINHFGNHHFQESDH